MVTLASRLTPSVNLDTDSPALYQVAFEHAPIGVAVVGLDGAWMKANRALCSLFGYPWDQLRKMTFQELTHPDDLETDLELVRATIAGERSTYRLEKRYIRNDGAVIYAILSVTLIRSPAGEPLYFISQIQDVTDQKLSEEKLIETERHFRRMTDQAPVMLWTMDAGQRFQHFNRAFLDFTGMSESDAHLNGWQGAVHPADLEESTRVTSLAFEQHSAFRHTCRMRRRDGAYRTIENAGSPYFTEAGELEGYVGTCTDITETLEAHERARELTERLSLAINAAKIGVFDWDIEANSIQCDRRSRRIHGLPDDGPDLSPDDFRGCIIEEDRPKFDRETAMALESDARLDTIYRARIADERLRHIRAIGQVVRSHSGEATRVVGFLWDVTEQNAAEAEIRAAMEAAKRADLAKSTFLATMSHEIRTPLNGIIGFTHLLLDSNLPPHLMQLAKPILAGGEALLAIINDILDYSKIEAGRVQLERLEFSVATILREAMDLIAPKASEKGLTVELCLGSSLPGDVVGDPNRLRQILANLASNAVKFTENGKIVIDARGEILPGSQCLLHISVTDTGIGIPPEKIGSLFEPFNQLDASTTRRFGGTGLGLAISKRLVDAMGGTLTADSEPNVSTTFRLAIPLALAAAPEFVTTPPARAKSMTQRIIPIHPVSTNAQNLKLLVAEDNEINQRLIRQILTRMGFNEVTVVDNGQEALDAVESNSFDAILMDCQMPVMDGYEAARHLRAAGHTIPIVALTAAALSGDKERAIDAGMTDYVTKPIRPDLLAEAIERVAGPRK